MYLVAIAWMYVVVMMSVAEATSTTGTILGAIVTFALYGILPCVILMYLMGTPIRNRARQKKDAAELAQLRAHTAEQETSGEPDATSEAPADAISTVRKEV
jgi:uncharacterized membrane protein